MLIGLVALLGWRSSNMTSRSSPAQSSAAIATADSLEGQSSDEAMMTSTEAAAPADLGPRHQLTYNEWLDILRLEAEAIATNPPEHLSILMGDSISLWFPHDLLPRNTTWLNQGISGEVSAGLLRRLDFIQETDPDVIFILIGINDLVRGVSDSTLMANQQQIVQDLKSMHPDAVIVVQSILPHAGTAATWEGKDRLLDIPNERIQALNQQLRRVARAEKVEFLDLYSLFSNAQGNLRTDLSTDGLHLNDAGYMVWASALQVYHQLELTNSP